MIRNYKAFGVALVAVFAISAFVAQAASAVPLTLGSNPAFLTGDQDNGEHVFVSSAEVKCKKAVFTAKTEALSVNEITVSPTYSECTAFGSPADVKVNGCTYTFTTPTTITANEATIGPSQLHIVCGATPIEVTPTAFGVSVCTQKVNTQTPGSGHVIVKNAGTAEKMDVTLEITLGGIAWTGSGGVCGSSGNAATYTGKSTVQAFKNSAHTEPTSITID